jgi:hypothetical protein
MRAGARSQNEAPSRQGRARSRIPAAVLALLVALALGACADPTGEVDDQGHNGYDEMTCEQAKSFALDISYGTVFADSAGERMTEITTNAAKASHVQVRQAAMSLISGYRAHNKATESSASAALAKVCEM